MPVGTAKHGSLGVRSVVEQLERDEAYRLLDQQKVTAGISSF